MRRWPWDGAMEELALRWGDGGAGDESAGFEMAGCDGGWLVMAERRNACVERRGANVRDGGRGDDV